MLRYFALVITSLIIIMTCSPTTDVAVTQTGNPSKVTLAFKAETAPNAMAKIKAPVTISSLTITSAYFIVENIEMKPLNSEEYVLFKEPNPYIVDLVSDTGIIIIDSAFSDNGNKYKEISMHIGPFDGPINSVQYSDSLLKTCSIVIRGYRNNDTLQPFVFSSSVDDEFNYESDSAMTISENTTTNVLVSFKIYQWFTDALGNYLDPEDTDNKEIIINNIFKSVSIHEQKENETDTDKEDIE